MVKPVTTNWSHMSTFLTPVAFSVSKRSGLGTLNPGHMITFTMLADVKHFGCEDSASLHKHYVTLGTLDGRTAGERTE